MPRRAANARRGPPGCDPAPPFGGAPRPAVADVVRAVAADRTAFAALRAAPGVPPPTAALLELAPELTGSTGLAFPLEPTMPAAAWGTDPERGAAAAASPRTNTFTAGAAAVMTTASATAQTPLRISTSQLSTHWDAVRPHSVARLP